MALAGAVIGLAGWATKIGPKGYLLALPTALAAVSGALIWRRFSHPAGSGKDKAFSANGRRVPTKPRSALPAQIPALFLFNTLHNISALALLDSTKASVTVEKLAEFIRSTTELSKQKTTLLAQELKCVELYLGIEKARFGARFEIISDIDPACLEAQVPSLLLLPIVENAVRYGVERSDLTTQVILSGRKVDNCIVVEISDTGQGISAEQVKTVLQGDGSLAELNDRLHHLFGEAAQMRIEALAPSGVRVKITIPQMTDLKSSLEGA